MTLPLVCFLVNVATPQGAEPPSAEQFRRMIDQLHATIRDVSFLYEGSTTVFGPPDEVASPIRYTVQGRYTTRSDGRTYLDLYERQPGTAAAFSRTQSSLGGGRLESQKDIPDLQAIPFPVESTPGSGAALNSSESPHRFLWLWYFRENRDLDALGYRAEWENVGGRRCLKVILNGLDDPDGNFRNEFWIDLERGGHPMRVDMYRQGELMLRVRDVLLGRFKATDGQDVWIPERAEVDGFASRDGVVREPTSLSVYEVANGSIRINVDPADSAFALQPVSGQTASPELRRMQEELEQKRRQRRRDDHAIRTDPEGVRLALDAALAEADAQSRQVEASSPARRRVGGSDVVRWGLIGLGVALAGAAVVIARRNAS